MNNDTTDKTKAKRASSVSHLIDDGADQAMLDLEDGMASQGVSPRSANILLGAQFALVAIAIAIWLFY